MKREDLEKLGLTAEALGKAGLEKDVIDKLMALHGKDIESHKSQTTTDAEEIKTLKGQLKTANEQIAGFKDLKPEELHKSVEDWKTKAEQFEQDAKTAREEADQKLEQYKFNTDLSEVLKSEYRAKDPADILPRLNLEKIQRGDEGKGFVGLKEQVEPLVESKDYLFTPENEDDLPRIVKGGKSGKVIDDKVVSAARQAAGVETQKSE